MYESPVEILYHNTSRKIDDGIYEAIVNVGVNVDKDELIRALQYDRDQYDKGYEDGFKRGAEEFAERLSGDLYKFPSGYKAQLRKMIDNLVAEMVEQWG